MRMDRALPLTGKSNEYAVEPDASAAMAPIAMGFLPGGT